MFVTSVAVRAWKVAGGGGGGVAELPPPQPASRYAGALCFSFSGLLAAHPRQSSPQQPSAQRSSATPEQVARIPRQQAQNAAALDGIIRDSGFSNITVPVPGAILTLRSLQTGQTISGAANGEGVFRIFPIQPGHYERR